MIRKYLFSAILLIMILPPASGYGLVLPMLEVYDKESFTLTPDGTENNSKLIVVEGPSPEMRANESLVIALLWNSTFEEGVNTTIIIFEFDYLRYPHTEESYWKNSESLFSMDPNDLDYVVPMANLNVDPSNDSRYYTSWVIVNFSPRDVEMSTVTGLGVWERGPAVPLENDTPVIVLPVLMALLTLRRRKKD